MMDGIRQQILLCTIHNTAVVPFRILRQSILRSQVQLSFRDRCKALKACISVAQSRAASRAIAQVLPFYDAYFMAGNS